METLNYMNDFFLNKTNIKNIVNNCFILNKEEERVEKEKKNIVKKEKLINEKDKLFWFWYVFMNGFDNYEMLGKNLYKKEMEIKTKLVELINKQKKTLKKFKIKVNDIEQNIVYDTNITINSFMVILYINSINLVYFTDYVYYETTDFEKTIFIYHDKKNDIFEMKENIEKEELKKTRLIISSLAKQVKAISNYKLSDLQEMCKKLSIQYIKIASKSYTKKYLYEKIINKIS